MKNYKKNVIIENNLYIDLYIDYSITLQKH